MTVATKPSSFPSGTVGGGWVFYLREQKGGNPQKLITGGTSATFDVVADTSYVAGAQRLTLDETPLGELVEVDFDTFVDSVIIDTASSLSVSVSE